MKEMSTTMDIIATVAVISMVLQSHMEYTFNLKSLPLRYGDLNGFLENLPLLKSPTLRQSKTLSIILMNVAVSCTSSPPVSLSAVATLLLRTCYKSELDLQHAY